MPPCSTGKFSTFQWFPCLSSEPHHDTDVMVPARPIVVVNVVVVVVVDVDVDVVVVVVVERRRST